MRDGLLLSFVPTTTTTSTSHQSSSGDSTEEEYTDSSDTEASIPTYSDDSEDNLTEDNWQNVKSSRAQRKLWYN